MFITFMQNIQTCVYLKQIAITDNAECKPIGDLFQLKALPYISLNIEKDGYTQQLKNNN